MSSGARVLYIMGEGRSGSTILDLMLGSHRDVFGAGELWSFFADDARRTGSCSCGAAFGDCRFWSEVRVRFVRATGESGLQDANLERPAWDRARSFLSTRDVAGSRYARDTLAIYRVLNELSGRPVVVDSTKMVARAANLLRIPGLDVRVLHLVRDGRGVAWSRMRDRLRDPGARRHGPMRSILHWVVKNELACRVARQAGERYLLVRYEDLVRRPREEFRRILAWSGLPPTDPFADPSGAMVAPGHQIGGNQAARAPGAPRELRLDDEWRRRLPARYDRLYRWTAGPLARRMGYRV